MPALGVTEQHVQHWLVRTVGLLWIAQLGPWVFVAGGQDFASPAGAAVIVGSYALYCLWGLILFGWILRDRTPGPRLVATMLTVMGICVLVVGLAAKPGTVVGWQNWTPAPATGVGMLAQALGGWWWGAASILVLGGTWALTALRDLPVAPQNMVTLAGNIGQLAGFTIVGGLVFGRLLRAARAADDGMASALAARAAEARSQERMRQYELLHTTVLTTLTLIARGDGTVSTELRARCGREVERLRTLVRSLLDGRGPGLGAAIAEAVLAQGSLGLRIHHEADSLPVTVPEEVVESLANAVTEALNNVVTHAETSEAWVVATGEADGGVRITVTDHGRGFDLAAATPGVGLTRTLASSVHEQGGRVGIRSWAGEGTSVELRWSP